MKLWIKIILTNVKKVKFWINKRVIISQMSWCNCVVLTYLRGFKWVLLIKFWLVEKTFIFNYYLTFIYSEVNFFFILSLSRSVNNVEGQHIV